MIQFKTIKGNGTAELIEKRSKFIANIFYVESIEEAEEHIKAIKKLYNDAKHNCFAYAIEAGNDGIAVKYNDDGEPGGTAGAPILKLILEKGLSNILVIVTRYFGGTLLGTGGLVRAYTEVTSKALQTIELIRKTKGFQVSIKIEYNNLEELKYFLKKNNIKINNIEYSDLIEVDVDITKELSESVLKSNKIDKIQILEYRIKTEKFVEI